MSSNTRFRVPAVTGKRLDELGVSSQSVLRHAGLPLGLFETTNIRLTTKELFALHQAVAEVSGDPWIGLKLGSEQRIERFDAVSITALYSRTLGDALQRIARYKGITGPEEIRVEERGSECVVEFLWLLAQEPEPAPLVDRCFAFILTIGSRGTGRTIRPLRIEFARAESHRSAYESHFGCPIQFGSEHNRLILRREELNAELVTHNPDLLEMVAPKLESELLDHMAESGLQQEVKRVLCRYLAGQRPRLEDIAQELRVSPRTLQRRLLGEGLTFHGLIEEARREMARHYLRQPSLALTETAYLLGYEDPSSFTRAFHKWEGTSPGEWRSLQQRTG